MIYASRASRCAILPIVSMPFPCRADFRLAPSQWETSLQSNAVSHCLGANLESALPLHGRICVLCYWQQIYYVNKLTLRHSYTDFNVTDSSSMTMTSNGNISRLMCPLWGDSTGHRWIRLTKASNGELWCFLCCAPQQTAKKAVEMLVIWDAIALTMTSL